MNSLKRIIISLKSQIDHVADDFENHEALAAAAIQDLQGLASKTRLHLHRIRTMSDNYQKQLQQQHEDAELWSNRAIKTKQSDQQKALQCVKRLRHTQKQISFLEQKYQECVSQEEKIRTDLEMIQEQLLNLKNKKEILAARQNRQGVQKLFQDKRTHTLQDAENLFQRWEESVVSGGYEPPDYYADSDPLASTFEQEEEEQQLRKMLNELVDPENSSDQNT